MKTEMGNEIVIEVNIIFRNTVNINIFLKNASLCLLYKAERKLSNFNYQALCQFPVNPKSYWPPSICSHDKFNK